MLAYIKKIQFRLEILQVTIRVLNKHRKKQDSLLFLIQWGFLEKPKQNIVDILPPIAFSTLNLKENTMRRLAGIYMGLEKEIGQIAAMTATTELVGEISFLISTKKE